MNDNKKKGLMLLLAVIVIVAVEIAIAAHFVNQWTADAGNSSAAPEAAASAYTLQTAAAADSLTGAF